MYLHVQYRTRIARDAPDDFVRTAEIEIREYGEFVEEGTFLVGLLEINRVLWAEAEDLGWDRWDICDNESEDLVGIFEALLDSDGQLREEFQSDEVFEDLIVIERILFHPQIIPCTQHILAAVLNLFGSAALVATWREVISASDKELAQLGFRKAAETNLIYRHTSYAAEYEDIYPTGNDDLVEADEDCEDWIIRKWGPRCFD